MPSALCLPWSSIWEELGQMPADPVEEIES
jgi:hypothetical protein